MSKIAKALVVNFDDPKWFVEYQLGQLVIMGFKRVMIIDDSFGFPYVRKQQAALDLLWHWWGCGLGKRYYATEDGVRFSLLQTRSKTISWALAQVEIEVCARATSASKILPGPTQARTGEAL